MKRLLAGFAALLILLSQIPFGALTAQAAVSTWDKGASIVPASTTDFGSSSFEQSLRNLKATGANYVSLVVPYYQSNINSSDIAPGYNTPTDASLTSAIDYAHSIGLAVALKVHVESNDGNWRAYINPTNRDTWYSAYNSILQHLGQIAQAHQVEIIVIGTEMVSTASSNINSDNTERWQGFIANLRKIYTGKLTYDANSTNNNGDSFQDEKESIGFWQALDYVGLSVYYNLNTSSDSVSALESQWDYWNVNDLKSFEQRVGKPLLFMEVGYRSLNDAHASPWDSARSGTYDATEQANDYQALLTYWNNYSYVAGIFWWNWQSDPNAGGAGNIDYTVQNKPALQVLTSWFTNPQPPGMPGTSPTLTSSATANPSSPQANTPTAVSATISNSGGTLQQAIVDIEVYNQSGTRVFQQFFDNQTISNGQNATYTANWTPGTAGSYRVAVGIFNGDWSQNYSWNSNALTIAVAGGTQPPPSNPPPSSGQTTDIWWPTSGSSVSGVQPFKAMVEGTDVSQYSMYWQVDGGALNQMGNSSTDYPHKEALVDLSGWKWSANHRYTVTFVSKNSQGAVISQKSEVIIVQ